MLPKSATELDFRKPLHSLQLVSVGYHTCFAARPNLHGAVASSLDEMSADDGSMLLTGP